MRHSRLLDRGNETAILYPQIYTTDARRNRTATWDPTKPKSIRVTATTNRQSDAEVAGQLSVRSMTIMTREPISGSWGRVKFRGEWWDLERPPTESGVTKATRHWAVDIRSRNDQI